jgi:proteasome alpha subunit
MYTPYDWQEMIGNRAQFIEDRLRRGTPVLAASCKEGIVAYTLRKNARKLYEVYDRLMMGAVGQQADMEAMRVAAIEFTSKEGYSRSELDVGVQRVTMAISSPMKRAFSDFSSAPFSLRILMMEVNARPIDDVYFVIDYDGEYQMSSLAACVIGDTEKRTIFNDQPIDASEMNVEDTLELLRERYEPLLPEGLEKSDLIEEASLLSRDPNLQIRFSMLRPT